MRNNGWQKATDVTGSSGWVCKVSDQVRAWVHKIGELEILWRVQACMGERVRLLERAGERVRVGRERASNCQ